MPLFRAFERKVKSVIPIRPAGSTGEEINNFCLREFGPHRFVGVLFDDQVESSTLAPGQCCIVNTSRRGVHWYALAKHTDGRLLMYDSFGRDYEPKKIKNKEIIYHSDSQPEQRDEGVNCGQLSVAWLMTYYSYGLLAMYV